MADALTSFLSLIKPEVNVSTTWPTSLNSDMDSIDTVVAKPRQKHQPVTWGATSTLDLSLAHVFTATNTAISTIAFTNVPSNASFVRLGLILTNGGANAITWPASVVWLAGIAPRFKAAGVDIVELVTVDGGTTWYGAVRVIDPGLIYANANVSTNSTSDASVVSYVLPAATLGTNGQGLRIKCSGVENGADIGTLHIKFGTQDIVSQAMGAGGGYWTFEATIIRTGAATANLNTLLVYNATSIVGSGSINSLTQTLANAVTIDFRATTANAGSPFYYSTITVELLPAP